MFIAAFIVFLTIVIPLTLFTPTHVVSKMYVNTNTPGQEQQIGSLFIEFENETTESEVKTILENYNMTVSYSMDYDFATIDP